MSYDPRSALRALVKGSQPRVSSAPLQAADTVYEGKGKPDTLCFLLLQFTTPNNSLPEDFFNLPREKGKSGPALKAHVRPDGGVFLGAFEAPDDGAGLVIVYGDPLMSEQDAIAVSKQYRKQVTQEILQRRDAQVVKPKRSQTLGEVYDQFGAAQ